MEEVLQQLHLLRFNVCLAGQNWATSNIHNPFSTQISHYWCDLYTFVFALMKPGEKISDNQWDRATRPRFEPYATLRADDIEGSDIEPTTLRADDFEGRRL